jgi:flagellin-like protein
MKNFKMSRKGISPIFATLILIAIAVIAGVVVYMFTSGTLASMTGSTTAAQEKVAVQGVQGTITGLTVYAQNQGSGQVKITSVMIKDSTGAIIEQSAPTTASANIAGNALGSVITGTLSHLSTNTPYTVTLVSSLGGSFVSSSFTLTS